MSPRFEKLKNGLNLLLVPCEAESVAVGMFIASGSAHESADVAGISHFIEHMLFKGTASRKQIDITHAIEGKGGNFNAYTSEESTCYFVHMPSECISTALDILSDMYKNAAIDEMEFEREKEVVIEELKMYADDPDTVAMENLQRNLFPDSQLGAPVGGAEKSVRPLKRMDLKRYIASHYTPEATSVVIVGNFDSENAIELTERYFK